MNIAVISKPTSHPDGRIRLLGSVAGVVSCELVADCDELVIGAGTDCDLTVADPLFPRRAFRLTRQKCHCGTEEPCRCSWHLATLPNSRIFVNSRLVQNERLRFGDTIAGGCHSFVFSRAFETPRNRRANVNVGDICRRLLAEPPIPPGFWSQSPARRYLARKRRALIFVSFLAVLALLALWLAPEQEFFAEVQEPLDVEMVAEQTAVPAPDAVRSLDSVQRKTITEAGPDLAAADLKSPQAQAFAGLAAEPVLTSATPAQAPAPPPPQPQAMESLTLAPLKTETKTLAAEVLRAPAALAAAGAPRRRLTVEEAQQAGALASLGAHRVAVSEALPASASARLSKRNLGERVAAASAASLKNEGARNLQALAALTPSPVQFEKHMGETIPVARISEQLTEMKQAAGDKEYKADGRVSDGEIAMSWKSGRFHVHAPGKPPPEGTPPTYCYVGKAEANGKPHLYVSFVCMDPNLDSLISKTGSNRSGGIPSDDSVEIYLDTKLDRKSYYQLMVNCRGVFDGHKHPDHKTHNQWGVTPLIKTSINREAGQWTCEAMIPFDQLGGVPAKGARWGVNFVRNYRGQVSRRPDTQIQCWFEVYRGMEYLHNPDLFGVFQW